MASIPDFPPPSKEDLGHQNASLNTWDVVTMVSYFVIVFAVGIIATVRANRNTSQGFFLAGRSITFLPIAGSIFATNMGANTFVGLAGSGAATGFAPVMFEWHATYMLVLLGWLFVPIYIASGTYTMPEYLKKRYGGQRLQVYFALIQLLLAVLSGISAEMYAASLFVEQLLGWDMYLSSVVILAITAVYTLGGGLTAVIYTDTLQTAILVGGSIVVTVMSMEEIGGYEAMVNRFRESASSVSYYYEGIYRNNSCGFPPQNSFNIFRGIDSDYPWPGLVFGLTLLALYYFCTNQVIVQRNLAAKNVAHSKAACVVASYLKILPFFLFIWPGMVSRILYPDEIGCSDSEICKSVCSDEAGCTNLAYPFLVLRILPSGLRGLMLAGLLAALMSSLTSQFNSSSSIFSIDIWKRLRPKANEFESILVGRVFGLFMIGASIAWLPILQSLQGGNLWDYLQSISSYITPPWTVVFILGMFWKRCTERGAWWGLMAGLVTGVSRMGVHFAYSSPICGEEEDSRPEVLTRVHYLHFAIILAAVTTIVTIWVSIATPPRKREQLHRVTWWTRLDNEYPELTDDEEEYDDEENDQEPSSSKPGVALRIYNFLCGVSNTPPPKLTAEEKMRYREEMTSIQEDPYWSKICDINAVIAIGVTCFIIGFYA